MRSKHPFAASVLALVFVSPVLTSIPTEGSPRPSAGTVITSRFSIRQNDTGAHVSIAGKVKTPDGRAIKGAYIVIRDANTNEVVRATYSSTFGFYRLEQIETGRTYVLSIAHRRYLFALAAQLLEINEDRSGVDFVGEPSDD